MKRKYNEFFEFVTSSEYEEIRDLIINNISESNVKLGEILKFRKDDMLKVPIKDFFQSIFYMHINRLFVS